MNVFDAIQKATAARLIDWRIVETRERGESGEPLPRFEAEVDGLALRLFAERKIVEVPGFFFGKKKELRTVYGLQISGNGEKVLLGSEGYKGLTLSFPGSLGPLLTYVSVRTELETKDIQTTLRRELTRKLYTS